jgi:hypothetical protein
MKKTIQQISEDFSKHRFEDTFPHFSDTIQWHLIGDKVLIGKDDIVETCRQSAQYLSGVTTRFKKFKTIIDDNCVVIDSLADYIDESGNITTVSSCDIYEFTEGQLSEITSYCIEIKNHKNH